MAQPFRPWANKAARWGPPLLVLLGMVLITASAMGLKSDFNTGVNVPVPQPVLFSHKHHVQGLGLDCRYCHKGVETSSFAGIPDTHTCMGCHSVVWPTSPLLEPVRESEARGTPIPWRRVNQLPDHVYFNHSAHINHGIGCATCHGNVSQMPLIRKTNAFFMSECLSCHQNPDPYLRPKSEIFNEDFHGNSVLGAQLRKEYRIHPERLIQCSVCHR